MFKYNFKIGRRAWIKIKILWLKSNLDHLDTSFVFQEITFCEYTKEKEIIENKIKILKEKITC